MTKYDKMNLSQLQRLASQGDSEAEFLAAQWYFENMDWGNAINSFNKIIDNTNHPQRVTAIGRLAQIYVTNGSPFADKKEAVRLYEMIKDVPTAVLARLNLGFLYSETGRIDEGIDLIETALKQIIVEDGNDDYLKQIECYKIAVAYEGAQCFSLAVQYYNKAIARCDKKYESDRLLIQQAQEGISNSQRRKAMGLEDRGERRPSVEVAAAKERGAIKEAEKAKAEAKAKADAEAAAEKKAREEREEAEAKEKDYSKNVNRCNELAMLISNTTFDYRRIADEYHSLFNFFRSVRIRNYREANEYAQECQERAAEFDAKYQDAYCQDLTMRVDVLNEKAKSCRTSSDYERIADEYRLLASSFETMKSHEKANDYAKHCRKMVTEYKQAAEYEKLVASLGRINEKAKSNNTSIAFKKIANEYKLLVSSFDAIANHEQAKDYARQCSEKETEYHAKYEESYCRELMIRFDELSEKTKVSDSVSEFQKIADEYRKLATCFEEISGAEQAADYARQCKNKVTECKHAAECEELIKKFDRLEKAAEGALNKAKKVSIVPGDYFTKADEYESLAKSFLELASHNKAKEYASKCTKRAKHYNRKYKALIFGEKATAFAGRILQVGALATFAYVLLKTGIVQEGLGKLEYTTTLADLALFILPLLFYGLGVAIFSILFLEKGRRYNYIFYLVAIAAQFIRTFLLMRGSGNWYRFTDYLWVILLLFVAILPGAILGLARRKHIAVFLLVITLALVFDHYFGWLNALRGIMR